jgi:hypothetical protein
VTVGCRPVVDNTKGPGYTVGRGALGFTQPIPKPDEDREQLAIEQTHTIFSDGKDRNDCLAFGRCVVRVSGTSPSILTEAVHGFPLAR